MVDTVSLKRLNQLHPLVKDLAIEAYNEAVKLTPVGVHPFITQTMRTFEESDALYAQGRTKPGPIVSNVKGGRSFHNYGLAIDFVNKVNDQINWTVDANWMIVVKCFKQRGFKWGGDWTGSLIDYPHFEMSFGLSTLKLLAKHNSNQFIAGTKFVVIP